MRINLDWLKLDTIKAGVQLAYGVAFLLLLAWVAPEIKGAARMLVARFDSATALEVAGLKLTFTDASISRGFDLVKIKLEGDNRAVVLRKIRELDAKLFIRLMTIGRTSSSCEYEVAEPKMRSDVALDYELAARALTLIEPSPKGLEDAREARRQSIAAGKPWTIGEPRACYTMTLTAIGSDVKTGIVTNIAPAFNGPSPGAAPVDMPKEMPKVTAMN